MDLPLYFVFIWIPDKEKNPSFEEGERNKRRSQFRNAISLFSKDCSFGSELRVAQSMEQLIQFLRPIEEYRPVYILVGHGDHRGYMSFMNGTVLTPERLVTHWHWDHRCDLIASQCGANLFVNHYEHPALLGMGHVRFLAAAEPCATVSHLHQFAQGQFVHLQLMRVILNYLSHYSHAARTDTVASMVPIINNGNQQLVLNREKELMQSVKELFTFFIKLSLHCFQYQNQKQPSPPLPVLSPPPTPVPEPEPRERLDLWQVLMDLPLLYKIGLFLIVMVLSFECKLHILLLYLVYLMLRWLFRLGGKIYASLHCIGSSLLPVMYKSQ